MVNIIGFLYHFIPKLASIFDLFPFQKWILPLQVGFPSILNLNYQDSGSQQLVELLQNWWNVSHREHFFLCSSLNSYVKANYLIIKIDHIIIFFSSLHWMNGCQYDVLVAFFGTQHSPFVYNEVLIIGSSFTFVLILIFHPSLQNFIAHIMLLSFSMYLFDIVKVVSNKFVIW